MEHPSESAGWIAVGVAVVVGVEFLAYGAVSDAVWPFVGGGEVDGTAVGGAAGYLAVVGRDAEVLRADVDYRFSLPAGALVLLAGVAVVTAAVWRSRVAGVEVITLAEIVFAIAFFLLAAESFLTKDRPSEGVGQLVMGAGWVALFWPGLRVPFLGGGAADRRRSGRAGVLTRG